VSGAVGTCYAGAAFITLGEEERLFPVLYKNLKAAPLELTSNVFREALLDFYDCRALIIVLDSMIELDSEGDWARAFLISAVRRGVPVRLYIADSARNRAEASTVRSSDLVSELSIALVRARIVTDVDDFISSLRNDFGELMEQTSMGI
jgi:hypothetical protein